MNKIETSDLKEAGLVDGIVMWWPGFPIGVIDSRSNLKEPAMTRRLLNVQFLRVAS